MILEFIEEYPFVLSFILGLIPALIWLWFWLREDTHPEPAKMITLSFIGGMVAVLFVLPIQKQFYVWLIEQPLVAHDMWALYIWAALEEITKFMFAYAIALRWKKVADEPVDDIIYLIISSLGFVTLENTLFLMDPIGKGQFFDTVVHGNLRFIGASLLHIMSSATIGICMALSFYKEKWKRIIYTVFGIFLAIILHAAFNLFIIEQAEGNIFFVFGTVWLCIIILLLMLEKVKHFQKTHSL